MRPSPTMEATIGKKRYRVATSTLLAHDSFGGRGVFLYLSPGGRYFIVRLTQWEGERDTIEPLDVEAAYNLYERLPQKELPVEEAFPRLEIEEA